MKLDALVDAVDCLQADAKRLAKRADAFDSRSDAKVMWGGGGTKREGAQACVDKKPRASNPYKEGTKERDVWFKGWDQQNAVRY